MSLRGSLFVFELRELFSPKPLLMSNYLEFALDQTKLKFVKGIKNSMVVDDEKVPPKLSVQTEGINFTELYSLSEHIELDKIYTNDVGAILGKYGIEACRQAIVKEISAVFKAYKITVDYRHLGLIADYITFSGSYRSFNRVGMETASSPFLKMTFETSMNYLMRACLMRERDDCRSASSRIVCGLVPRNGTNAFDLMEG